MGLSNMKNEGIRPKVPRDHRGELPEPTRECPRCGTLYDTVAVPARDTVVVYCRQCERGSEVDPTSAPIVPLSQPA